MSATVGRDGPERAAGVTDADRRVALRFALGRPGWRVEALTTARGEAFLRIATADPGTGAVRSWSVTRTREGFLVADAASGERFPAVPAMREALVEIWEATAGAAAD